MHERRDALAVGTGVAENDFAHGFAHANRDDPAVLSGSFAMLSLPPN
jgi:hypothetical protein